MKICSVNDKHESERYKVDVKQKITFISLFISIFKIRVNISNLIFITEETVLKMISVL